MSILKYFVGSSFFKTFSTVQFTLKIAVRHYFTKLRHMCAHYTSYELFNEYFEIDTIWLLCKFWYILTLVDVHNKLASTLTEGSVLFLFLSRFQYERYTKYFTFIVTNRLLKLTRHKRFIKQYQTNQYILLILISYKYHSSWSILVQKVYKYVDVSVFAGRDSINISTTP